MRYSLREREALHYEIVRQFCKFVVPALQDQGFERSPFSSHQSGPDGTDHHFYFVRLEEKKSLELVDCRILHENGTLDVHYNSFTLSHGVETINEFEGSVGLSLLTMPCLKTRMPVLRYVPIPFLYWPVRYKVRWNSKEGSLENSVMKTIQKLVDDISFIEITKAEWESQNDPIVVCVGKL